MIATIVILLIMCVVFLINSFRLKEERDALYEVIDNLKKDLAITRTERDLLKLKQDSDYKAFNFNNEIEELVKELIDTEEE